MRVPALLLLTFLACAGSQAPSLKLVTPFVDRANLPIPDQNQLERPLNVERSGRIVRATVEVILRHNRPDDLTLTLVSPAGTQVVLGARLADGGGRFRYALPLLALQGEAANGGWRLIVEDRITGETGTLEIWGLEFEALGP